MQHADTPAGVYARKAFLANQIAPTAKLQANLEDWVSGVIVLGVVGSFFWMVEVGVQPSLALSTDALEEWLGLLLPWTLRYFWCDTSQNPKP